MATPSKTPAMSTPKTSLTPTSVRKMASPRPVTAGKGISYKSPASAMKTPASHGHNISTSSQPSSTPLQAHGFVDGGVNLDSPVAALMGFSHSHGLTPIPQFDGMGLQTSSTKQSMAGEARNTEAERLQRLEEIAITLKTRIAGRGVTREGVVRMAKLSGFSTLWDEDILTVAGNCVDLELLWDHGQRDNVKDVVLKISAAGAEERQEEASEILKKNLAKSPEGDSVDPWNHLDKFASNLDRLGQLDKPSKGLNCFEAVDGLYAAYRTIWEEEKKRLTWKSDLRHLSRGSAGRPTMNKRRKLGLAIEYWAEKQELLEESFYEQGRGGEALCEKSELVSIWTAEVSCETGLPSLSVSKSWVSADIFGSEDADENVDAGQERALKPIWREPDSSNGEVDESMKIDDVESGIPKEPSARFTFTLGPMLHLPTSTVAAFEAKGLIIALDSAKVTTYQQALDALKTPSLKTLDPKQHGRWSRVIMTYYSQNSERLSQQSYALHSAGPLWCYPTERVAFSHPRQLAELLPTLRQYALLWSILRKLVANPPSVEPATELEEDFTYKTDAKNKSRTSQKRSNVDVRRKKLDDFLRSTGTEQDKAITVDISLTLSGSQQSLKPKLDMIVPLPISTTTKAKFAYVSFEIELDAKIVVLANHGLPSIEAEKGKKILSDVIALSEDLGVLVAWILEKATEGSSSD